MVLLLPLLPLLLLPVPAARGRKAGGS